MMYCFQVPSQASGYSPHRSGVTLVFHPPQSHISTNPPQPHFYSQQANDHANLDLTAQTPAPVLIRYIN